MRTRWAQNSAVSACNSSLPAAEAEAEAEAAISRSTRSSWRTCAPHVRSSSRGSSAAHSARASLAPGAPGAAAARVPPDGRTGTISPFFCSFSSCGCICICSERFAARQRSFGGSREARAATAVASSSSSSLFAGAAEAAPSVSRLLSSD